MSTPILSLNNAQNWQQLYRHRFVSEAIVKQGRITGHIPIPPQVLPILSEHRILAIGAHSDTAKSSWFSGGWLTAIVQCGGEFLEADIAFYRVPLNSARLILMPSLSQSYKLRFRPHPWFEDVTLTIYQYIGTESDRTEDLIRELAAVDLARIEAKIDSLRN